MTWFQAFKIAFMGGETVRATGRQRQRPCNRISQAPAVGVVTSTTRNVGVGTLTTRDATTTEQLGQDDSDNLDYEGN